MSNLKLAAIGSPKEHIEHILDKHEYKPYISPESLRHKIIDFEELLRVFLRYVISFRRKQVATRLVQAMEHNFHSHSHVYPLEKGKEYAFSHTTPDGSKFASKHTGGFFLTYNPSIRRN